MLKKSESFVIKKSFENSLNPNAKLELSTFFVWMQFSISRIRYLIPRYISNRITASKNLT